MCGQENESKAQGTETGDENVVGLSIAHEKGNKAKRKRKKIREKEEEKKQPRGRRLRKDPHQK